MKPIEDKDPRAGVLRKCRTAAEAAIALKCSEVQAKRLKARLILRGVKGLPMWKSGPKQGATARIGVEAQS